MYISLIQVNVQSRNNVLIEFVSFAKERGSLQSLEKAQAECAAGGGASENKTGSQLFLTRFQADVPNFFFANAKVLRCP